MNRTVTNLTLNMAVGVFSSMNVQFTFTVEGGSAVRAYVVPPTSVQRCVDVKDGLTSEPPRYAKITMTS